MQMKEKDLNSASKNPQNKSQSHFFVCVYFGPYATFVVWFGSSSRRLTVAYATVWFADFFVFIIYIYPSMTKFSGVNRSSERMNPVVCLPLWGLVNVV